MPIIAKCQPLHRPSIQSPHTIAAIFIFWRHCGKGPFDWYVCSPWVSKSRAHIILQPLQGWFDWYIWAASLQPWGACWPTCMHPLRGHRHISQIRKGHRPLCEYIHISQITSAHVTTITYMMKTCYLNTCYMYSYYIHIYIQIAL